MKNAMKNAAALKNKMRICTVSLSAVMLASLAACGGGGGGSGAMQAAEAIGKAVDAVATIGTVKQAGGTGASGATGGGTVQGGNTQAAPIVASVAAPTYPAGSEELAAFKLINAERSKCGFGLVAQNVQIDAAAKAHSDYQIRNNVDSHLESRTQFPAGFTGVTSKDRLAFQGYVNAGATTDEYSFYSGVTPRAGKGERSVRFLLGAPYHLRGMMGGYRDVGMSLRTNAELGKTEPVMFFGLNMAYKQDAGPQTLGVRDVLTYPCEGSKGVNRALYDEKPAPVPGRNLWTNPLGTPVYVAVKEGQKLTITRTTITQLSSTKGVTVRAAVTGANDPNGPCDTGCFKSHEGYVIPDAPLLANTEYLVTIEGTNNGVLFTRGFRFTTGS